MKKNIFYILAISLFFTAPIFAQNKTTTVQVLTPDLENISAEEKWLQGQIQDKLKENLQDYAKFITVVDDSNETQLKALQRKSESSMYDEETAIEAGHLTSASSAVFTTIRKAGSVYTIGVNYMDLRTGIHETVTSSGRKNTEDLFDSTGCAIDELTLKLCEKLKINLSGTEKYVLQHGRAELTVDQQLAMAKADAQNYENQLADLDKQIASLSVSTNLDASGLKKKIEAQKALLEEKQAAADRRLKELNEQNQKKLEDAQKEAERSLEIKNKRDEIEKKAEKKAEEVRKLSLEKENVLGKISVIESKKRALVEIRETVKESVKELSDQAEKDVLAKTDEINAKPYRKIDLSTDGQPTEIAIQRRKTEIEEETAKIKKNADDEIAKRKASTKNQEDKLYKEIHKDYKKIQGKQTISSLGEELKVSYGLYDGEKQAWPIQLYLYCDKILLTEEKIWISYYEIAGKEAPDLSKAREKTIDEYANNVDIYDSLLSRGTQILRFEMDYHVEPEADKKPSTYRFYFDELRVYDTIKNKVISIPEITTKVRERTMSPIYDIRTEEVQISDAIKQKKHDEKVATFKQSAGGGGMSGFFVSYGQNENGKGLLDASMRVAIKSWDFIYIGFGFDGLRPDIFNNTYFEFGYGVNYRPFILIYPPSIYARAGLGFYDEDWKSKSHSDTSYSADESDTSFHAATGLEIPLSTWFKLYGECHFFYNFDKKNSDSYISVGISFGWFRSSFSFLYN